MERNPGKDWLEESPVCAAPEPPPETKAEKRKESKRMHDLAAVVKTLDRDASVVFSPWSGLTVDESIAALEMLTSICAGVS